jgi:hypothetical protein
MLLHLLLSVHPERNDGADRDKYHTFHFMLTFEFLTDSVTDSFPIKLAETASYRSTYDGTDPGISIEPITAPALAPAMTPPIFPAISPVLASFVSQAPEIMPASTLSFTIRRKLSFGTVIL